MKDEQGFEGVWRTVRGRRVFIRSGEELGKAMERSGKFKNLKMSKEEILNQYRRIKTTGSHEELQTLANEIYNSDEIDKQTKNNMISKLSTTDYIHNNKEIKIGKKVESKKEENKEAVKNIEDKSKEISEDIDSAISSIGEDGRFDIDNRNPENLYNEIYSKVERTLGRKITDNEYEFIDRELDKFYKDGMYISRNSYSFQEYQDEVTKKLDKVSSKLEDKGFKVQESHSQYAGLVASQYYTKDDITIRIGDHPNSTGYSASHTRDELYKSSVNDLVKYVENEYKKKVLRNGTLSEKARRIDKLNKE